MEVKNVIAFRDKFFKIVFVIPSFPGLFFVLNLLISLWISEEDAHLIL